MSVNQINAQTKLTEIWKAVNTENYPIKVNKHNISSSERISRSKMSDKLLANGFSDHSKTSFKNDAIRLWNNSPIFVSFQISISLLIE